MAEFKLGRIRFVWKNQWAGSTVYYKDDVVAFGGKVYICVLGHTSDADFFNDLDIVPSKWNLVSDGQTWKGDWTPQTKYVYNDIVKYGARLYICIGVHTSAADSTTGLEPDLANWQIFADGLEWKGDWATSYDYKLNDLVKYGGTTYVCITPHISAATTTLGLENDQSKWEIFNQGFEYKDTWAGTTRYKLNDVIKYGGTLYICITHHTSGADFATDAAKWTKFVEGIQFEEYWDDLGYYQQGDIVRYGGNQYISKRDNNGIKPPASTDDWSLFSEGLRFIGDWADDSSQQDYLPGDVVRVGAWTYKCVLEHQNQRPPNTTYWQRLNEGFRWRGVWLDDQEYEEGDVVRYADNSYVCTLRHISEGDDYSSVGGPQGGGNQGSRPDLADSGQYWSVIAIGSEVSVLTTKGDLVYYSGAAPTRLPIGTNGQILQVNQSGLPEWVSLNSTEDVYYVAGHGVDLPAPEYGSTLDRPWASIRYACQQIDRGTKVPVARKLLELNRRFIQREIVEWSKYQAANNLAPFSTGFSFETIKCERDMGLIVDALIWDITHGGNVKSREAALSYVEDGSSLYATSQQEETVAAINYGKGIIENILNQSDPSANYQTLNGDNSTAVVVQYKDSTVTAESGVYANITNLVKIITDAIEANDGITTDTTGIPARLINTVLLKVSTGKYYETLPIIVPAETCVIGDELRSTNVQPRKKGNSTLTPIRDFKYSNKALERVENIVGDIVGGIAVTPSTGNDEIQDQTWPYAETTAAKEQTSALVRNIRRVIDAKLGTKQEAILPLPYTLSDPNNGYARDLHLLNKEFIQAEVIAYVQTEYPTISYSKTSCKKDVGFIIDAIAYDLTYGGNWQSQTAGLAYYEGATLNIAASEKAATVAAYTYLKELLQTVGRNITVSAPYQSEVEQLGSEPGTITQSNIVGTLMDGIINIINNGIGVASITYPDVSGVNSALVNASTALVESLPTIQEQAIDFISENFGTFKYKSSVCRRDLRRIITDTAYDVAFNTNYNAVYNGIAYTRPSNAYNLQNQRTETIGAIRYARDQIAESVNGDGSSASGSATARTRVRAAFNEVVDILQNGTTGAADPGDGVVDALSFPQIGTRANTQNKKDALDNLVANRQFIIDDVVAYVNNNTPPVGYNQTKCARDVGYIVDAMSFDILYGGTLASTRMAQSYFGIFGAIYPAGQVTETVAAYTHMKTIMSAIIIESNVTAQSGNTTLQTQPGTPASATEQTELEAQIDIIINALSAGNLDSTPEIVYPSLAGVTAEFVDAKSNIDSDRENVIIDTIQYINTTYSGFPYDQAKCQRDISLIVDAARYDWMLGTNYASLIAGLSYRRAPASKVAGVQKTATIAANNFTKAKALLNVQSNATAIAGINSTWEIVNDTIFGANYEGGNRQNEDVEVYNAIRMLELNKEFIVEEAIAYTDEYFKSSVTATNSGTNTLTIADTSKWRPGDRVKFTLDGVGLDSFALSGLGGNQTYYIRQIVNTTEFTVSQEPGGTETDVLLSLTDTFNIEKDYTYNTAACRRDLREYIDAIKWDLTYPEEWYREYTDNISFYQAANYKTGLAARYYANSIIGSQEEDFYYLRNGTGLRLQTMEGLQGDLSADNEFGTKRPTAGAYASLDPGWGPNDTRAWITARSPYVQNCTTFGYAAIGQKIDGALHNGGNDSIVSNDFTQVISDGIGAWITNNGRAELVSVFTYYSHIGYLAENGGRIRATNGNNSYGKFGSVAEGVDPEEIPVTAVVDNETQYSATISNVLTDADKLLQFEYGHAGNDYTEASYLAFGPGDGEVIVGNEFRDKGVNRVRVVETTPGTAGGSGYQLITNVAQAGSANDITLAATDGNLSTAYPGMKIYITGGAGTGLFGIIQTYNSGSKVATVIKESTGTAGWDHVVPGTTFVAPNSTSTYLIEPRAQFSAAPKTTSEVTVPTGTYAGRCATFVETSKTFTNLSGVTDADGRDLTFDVTKVGEKYYVSINNAGTGYTRLETVTIEGTSVGGASPTNDINITLTSINSSSGAVIDFDFTGYGQKGYFIAAPVQTGLDFVHSSTDGNTWTAQTTPSVDMTGRKFASGLIDDGSSVLQQSSVVGYRPAGPDVIYDDASDQTSGNWQTATLPVGFTAGTDGDIAFGQISSSVGRYVIISDADTDIAYSDNGGATWSLQSSVFPGTGFSGLTFGLGKFVAVSSGSTSGAYSEDGGITWTPMTLPAAANWNHVVFGNGRFVAVASNSNNGAYSIDGINWVAMTLPALSSVILGLAYGQGMFAATNNRDEIIYSEDGINWNIQTVSQTPNSYNSIVFGSNNRDPKFIAFGGASSNANAALAVLGTTTRGRVSVANEQIFEIRITEPGSGYTSAPSITITDPGNLTDVELSVKTNSGILGQPSFYNRGSGFTTASAEIDNNNSNGFADFDQSGLFVAVKRLTAIPVNGSNVVFDSLPNKVFKLVNTVSLVGLNDGSKTAFLQLSPEMSITDAPADGDPVTMRIRFSQVRLTGHDFLDIGTGNFADTNYPGTPIRVPDQAKETVDSDGGRVFFTSTDQDGNFRVGDLFSVEQATGVATLNADAFNIAGLQELSLGEVTLGGNSASITEFSTDPFFTANSDNVVPTQRAIKAYIEAQIGGGGASLNVNSVTAGDIFINTNQITTVSGQQINIKANVLFEGSVLGLPQAIQYFLR